MFVVNICYIDFFDNSKLYILIGDSRKVNCFTKG